MFVGVDGINFERDLTTNYPDQAAIQRTMLKQARQKIGVTGTALICPIAKVDVFITNKGKSNYSTVVFIEKGIKVQKV